MAKALWAGLFCGMLAMAGCSQTPSDALIAADAHNRIGGDQRVQSKQVQISASHGVLTLAGTVSSEAERIAAGEDASHVEGFKVLVNNLEVAAAAQPAEPSQPVAVTHSVEIPQSQPAVASRKPSPAVTKPEPSTLPIVTDGPAVAQPVASVINPAASLPTRPVDSPSLPATPVRSTEPAPAAVAIAPKPLRVAVPYGTTLSVRLLESVSSDLDQPGDKFTASLASPVMIDDKVVIPAEAGIEGKVVEAESGGRFGGKPSLAIELTNLVYNGKSYSLRTSQFSKEGTSRTTRTAETIGGGAGIGAILGGLVGGGRGAAIGAAIGAGVGTGIQAKSKGSEVELPAETVLSFRLKGPIEVEAASTLQRAPGTESGSSVDPLDADRPVLKRRPGSGAADPDPAQDATSSSGTAASDNDSPPVLKRRPN